MEKILVIDDDESILVLLKKLLGEFNCELHEAETGQDGIQITEKVHPDVIITDLAINRASIISGKLFLINRWRIIRRMDVHKMEI